MALCNVGPDSLDVQAVFLIDGSKRIRNSADDSSMLLIDLSCPGSHISKALNQTLPQGPRERMVKDSDLVKASWSEGLVKSGEFECSAVSPLAWARIN